MNKLSTMSKSVLSSNSTNQSKKIISSQSTLQSGTRSVGGKSVGNNSKSTKFTIANSTAYYTTATRATTKLSDGSTGDAPEGTIPRIIINGVDRTPAPLCEYSDITLDDVPQLRPPKDDQETSDIYIPDGFEYPSYMVDAAEKSTVVEKEIEVNNTKSTSQSDDETIQQNSSNIRTPSRGSSKLMRTLSSKKMKARMSDEAVLAVDEEFHVKLLETPTISLFSYRGSVIANDAPKYTSVKNHNDMYDESLNNHRDQPHLFSSNFAQTFNKGQRNIGTSTDSHSCTNIGVSVSPIERSRTINKEKTVNEEAVIELTTKFFLAKEGCSDEDINSFTKFIDQECERKLARGEGNTGPVKLNDFLAERMKKRILGSEKLLSRCLILEKIVLSNVLNKLQIRYSGLPLNAGTDSKSNIVEKRSESLIPLFTYFNEKPPSGKSVTCMAEFKNDYLVVGYGNNSAGRRDENGYLQVWSKTNTHHPELVLETPSGVTAVAFCPSDQFLAAIGMVDGSVRILNLMDFKFSKTFIKIKVESRYDYHTQSVWQLKWVDRGIRGIHLLSISSDSRVLEWNLSSDKEAAQILEIKSIAFKDDKVRRAGGLCISFPKSETSSYFIGTDDGFIHKCSFAHREQYVTTYRGHKAPVYQIIFSPFVEDCFLSCSADWTARLWIVGNGEKSLEFKSLNTCFEVIDICWSPFNSTMFALITRDGYIEIWDISSSLLEPVQRVHVFNDNDKDTGLFSSLTTVLFGGGSCPVLFVGDDQGLVHVYELGPDIMLKNKSKQDGDQSIKLLDIIASNF